MNREQRRAEERAAKKKRNAARQSMGDTAINQNFQAAVAHFNNGHMDEAESVFRQVTKDAPNHVDGLLYLGIILMNSGRFDETIALTERALVNNPRHGEAYNILANCYQNLGQLDKAIDALEQALEISPGNPSYYNNLGSMLKKQGFKEKAIALLQKAISLKPDYADAYFNLGNTFKDMDRLEEAAGTFRKVIAINPNHAEGHCNLGTALKDLGHMDEALSSYQKALDILPGFAEAHFNIGNVYKDIGRYEDAIACYHRAIELEPENEESWNNLNATMKILTFTNPAKKGDVSVSAFIPSLPPGRQLAIHKLNLKAYRPHEADAQYDRVQATMAAPHLSPSQVPEDLPGRTVGLLHFGRSGTGLMHSLIDNHPEVTTQPSIYLSGYFNDGVWEDLIAGGRDKLPERFTEMFAVLFDATSPVPVPSSKHEDLSSIGHKEGMTAVGDNRDEVLKVDRTAFCEEAHRLLSGFEEIDAGLFLRILHAAYEFAIQSKDKKNTLFFHIHNPGIYAEFNFFAQVPDARMMMMTRNPIQCCESWVREPMNENDYLKVSARINNMLFSVDRISFRRHDSIGVRLEDLKSRPQATMQALCKWMGIEEDPSLYEMTAQGKKWWGDPSSPDYNDRNEMSPFDNSCVKRQTGKIFSERDCFVLETLFHPFSVRFGYRPDDAKVFQADLKEARALINEPFDFEKTIIENIAADIQAFEHRDDYLLLRAVLTDRFDVLDELGTYPHMLTPLDVGLGQS
jgi:tetratricopeptide (TPR) repeat protein